MSKNPPPSSSQDNVRRLLSRHLVGSGIELGPGHLPFPIGLPGCMVFYVDRLEPDEHRRLFPELPDDVEFPPTDIVCDLDVDRLKPIEDQSQDFVIASHVLEHVADPIGLLDEIHRVLRPGGVALILLPDRRRTFDRKRSATPLDHLVSEFEAKITDVDDDHIADFLRGTESPDSWARIEQMPAAERRELFDVQRRRSIHVHCWHEEEFVPVILFAIEQLGHDWELVDGVLAEDEGPDGFEFGFVLRRNPLGHLGAGQRSERFAKAWEAWAGNRWSIHEHARAVAEALANPNPSLRSAVWALPRRVARRARRPRSAVAVRTGDSTPR